MIRVQNVSEQHVKLIKIQEQSKRKMENDLNNMKNEVQQQKKEMHKMEKERNRAIEETMDLTQQVEDAMDEIKLKQVCWKFHFEDLHASLGPSSSIFEPSVLHKELFFYL